MDAHSDADRDAHLRPDADADGNTGLAAARPCRHRHADPDANDDIQSCTGSSDANRNGDGVSHLDVNAHSDGDSPTDADFDGDTDVYADDNADPDSHTDAHADVDGATVSNRIHHPYALGDIDRDRDADL